LIEKLKEVLGEESIKPRFAGISKTGKEQHLIRLNKKPTLKFLDYIGGKSPVRCFDYKFDLTKKAPITEKQKRAYAKRRRKTKQN
jgi:hypothetical protein